MQTWFKRFFRPLRPTFNRLHRILQQQLAQGTAPRQLALAIAVGATLGMLPIVWGTWAFCALFAYLMRLNQPLVQVAHIIVIPFHILTFVPYFQAAEGLYAHNLLPHDPAQALAEIKATPVVFFKDFWLLNLQATTVWLVTAPIFLLLFFLLARLCLKPLSGDNSPLV